MPRTERMHELAIVPPTEEQVRDRAKDGWHLAAVVWEREVSPDRDRLRDIYEVVPFGLKVAEDCIHLVDEPNEKEVILLALELIVQDFRLSQVGTELNRRGFRTRDGLPWNAASVFDLLPRLIDAGPRVFTSDEWVERRQRLFNAIQQ